MKTAIDRGLRAQLQTESLLTGVLYVGIDFFPGTPVKLGQAARSKYPEIPTVPTALERAEVTTGEILAKLREVDFKGLTDAVSRAVDGVGQLVNSPALKSALQRLDQTMPKIDQAIVEIRKMTSNLDGNITTLSTNLEQTSDAARGAMQQAALTLKQTDAALKGSRGGNDQYPRYQRSRLCHLYELGRSLPRKSPPQRDPCACCQILSQRNPRSLIFGRPEMEEEMNRSINSIFRIAVVGLSLAGCGTFSPRPDPSRFFTLSSLPQVAQASLKNSTGLEKMFLEDWPGQVFPAISIDEIVVEAHRIGWKFLKPTGGRNRYKKIFPGFIGKSCAASEHGSDHSLPVVTRQSAAVLRRNRGVTFRGQPRGRDGQLFARWSVLDGADKESGCCQESHALFAMPKKNRPMVRWPR